MNLGLTLDRVCGRTCWHAEQAAKERARSDHSLVAEFSRIPLLQGALAKRWASVLFVAAMGRAYNRELAPNPSANA
jgi:hypothetical protein